MIGQQRSSPGGGRGLSTGVPCQYREPDIYSWKTQTCERCCPPVDRDLEDTETVRRVRLDSCLSRYTSVFPCVCLTTAVQDVLSRMKSSGPIDRRTLVCLSWVRTTQQDGFPWRPEERQTGAEREKWVNGEGETNKLRERKANREADRCRQWDRESNQVINRCYLGLQVICGASGRQCWWLRWSERSRLLWQHLFHTESETLWPPTPESGPLPVRDKRLVTRLTSSIVLVSSLVN